MESDIHSKNTPSLSLTGSYLWDYLLVSIFPLCIYITAIYSWGPGITNDSVNYMAAALSLKEGMLKADSTPFFEWPPLFPLLLSPADFLQIDILRYSTLFHAILLIINNVLIYFILKKILTHKIVLGLAILVLTFSIPMIQIHIMVWSEPFFITLVLINILVLKKYIENPQWKYLLLLAILSVLLFLQRKTGIIFSAGTILFMLFYSSKRLFHIFSYSLLTAIPVFWWFKRRENLSGQFFGHSELKPEKLTDNLDQFMNTLTTYFFPMQFPISLRIILFLSILAAGLFLIRKYVKRRKINFHILASLWFMICYYLFIIIGLLYLHISEEIDDRILIPAYPFTIILFLYLTDTIYSIFSSRKYLRVICVIVFSGWLLYPMLRTLHHLNRWNTDGTGGYNTHTWQYHPLLLKIKNLHPPEIIYTNHVNSLFYHLNLVGQKNISVRPAEHNNHTSRSSLIICFDKSWLISGNEPDCYLEKWPDKKLIFKSSSGSIWETSAK